MRFALAALLATAACGQIFDLEAPTRRAELDDGGISDGRYSDAHTAPEDAIWAVRAFRRGVDGYVSTTDTFLDAVSPTSNNSSSIEIRASDLDEYGLLMFGGVFSVTSIPAGADIQLARLQLTSQDASCTGRLVEVAVAWNEATSFNTFGPMPGVQNTDLGAVVVAALPGVASEIVLDVTSSVQAWSNDPSANHGWMIEPLPSSNGNCKIRSGEVGNLNERPRLEVIYTN